MEIEQLVEMLKNVKQVCEDTAYAGKYHAHCKCDEIVYGHLDTCFVSFLSAIAEALEGLDEQD